MRKYSFFSAFLTFSFLSFANATIAKTIESSDLEQIKKSSSMQNANLKSDFDLYLSSLLGADFFSEFKSYGAMFGSYGADTIHRAYDQPLNENLYDGLHRRLGDLVVARARAGNLLAFANPYIEHLKRLQKQSKFNMDSQKLSQLLEARKQAADSIRYAVSKIDKLEDSIRFIEAFPKNLFYPTLEPWRLGEWKEEVEILKSSLKTSKKQYDSYSLLLLKHDAEVFSKQEEAATRGFCAARDDDLEKVTRAEQIIHIKHKLAKQLKAKTLSQKDQEWFQTRLTYLHTRSLENIHYWLSRYANTFRKMDEYYKSRFKGYQPNFQRADLLEKLVIMQDWAKKDMVFLSGEANGLEKIDSNILEDLKTFTQLTIHLDPQFRLCAEPIKTPLAVSRVEQWEQPKAVDSSQKLDVLFMVDTSASLDDNRETIAKEIQKYISQIPSNVDYQMAVMLGHIGEQYAGKLYQRSSEPSVLKSSAQSLDQILSDFRFKLDHLPGESTSDGGEANMYSLSKAISSPRLEEIESQGFFRSDAALAIVFVTDENDVCSRYLAPELALKGIQLENDAEGDEVRAYNQYCVDADGNPTVTAEILARSLKKFKGERPLIISGILYTGEGVVPTEGENEIGYGSLDFIRLEGGVAIDLADSAHIADGLSTIGADTANQLKLKKTFQLHGLNIMPKSIQVWVNKRELSKSSFSYDSKSKKVSLKKLGTFGSRITVRYQMMQ